MFLRICCKVFFKGFRFVVNFIFGDSSERLGRLDLFCGVVVESYVMGGIIGKAFSCFYFGFYKSECYVVLL